MLTLITLISAAVMETQGVLPGMSVIVPTVVTVLLFDALNRYRERFNNSQGRPSVFWQIQTSYIAGFFAFAGYFAVDAMVLTHGRAPAEVFRAVYVGWLPWIAMILAVQPFSYRFSK
jgi:hypothetical protein